MSTEQKNDFDPFASPSVVKRSRTQKFVLFMTWLVATPYFTYYMWSASILSMCWFETRNIFFPPSVDNYFQAFNAYILANYSLDAILSFFFVKGYKGSFYFYFDFISTGFLIAITIIQLFQNNSVNYQYLMASKLAKTLRVSKFGSKVSQRQTGTQY